MKWTKWSPVALVFVVILGLLVAGCSNPAPTPAPAPPASAPTARPAAAAPGSAPAAATPTATIAPPKPAAASTPTPVPAKVAPIVWKYSSYIGPETTVGEVSVWMLDEIEKRSQGRLKFERFWNASLAPVGDFPKMLKANLIQMALVGPAYSPTVFKLTRGFRILYGSGQVGASGDAYSYAIKKIVETYPPAMKEFADAGIKFLADNTGPEFLVYSSKPMWKWEDFKGKRVRIAGPNAEIFKEWGSSAVNIPFNEVYQGLQSGIIDVGTGLMFNSQLGMKFYEVAPYTIDPYFGGGNVPESISIKAWESLPADLRAVVESVGADFVKQKWIIEEKNARDTINQLQNTVTHIRWTKAERDRGIVQGKNRELFAWFDEMQKEGLPGKEFWDLYQSTMKDYMAKNKPIYFDPMESICKDGGSWKAGKYSPPPQ